MESAREWIKCDESAKSLMDRVSMERPSLLLPPPLHRAPLCAGNVVEIVGPSPSAKSYILLQAAINCILPKEWNGIHYGGLERLVMYFDLDCRFDVSYLSQSLKRRIVRAQGPDSHSLVEQDTHLDEVLFLACLKRFLYIRCYNSLEFLAALKTIRPQLQTESEGHGIGVHFLMFDSISAYYWIDRAYKPLSSAISNRKPFSLQSITEAVVQELRQLLQFHPMLVLATKPALLGLEFSACHITRKQSSSPSATGMLPLSRGAERFLYREYMPSAWQVILFLVDIA
ncbi:hypothetical protein AMTR_s00017p00136420 [Amborella trichopoda]|uniref:RecA family profile 1 domain-containing protein n=1 Tax=Amborella trichopoda TaxID=13333 RepID=W1PLM3_AMBTC|nr:hypothetical protein AMTR_s00017p00136420 [Amborella trichopoda]